MKLKSFLKASALVVVLALVSAPPAFAVIGAIVSAALGIAPNTLVLTVLINKGIDNAARKGNAPFHLVISASYPEFNEPVTADILLSETEFLGQADQNTVAVRVYIWVPAVPRGDVDATAKIVIKEADGTSSDVSEPRLNHLTAQ